MRRIRVIVEYDGTNYVGWQLQPNGVSVQQMLNQAGERITGEQIRFHGSGRTDSGVHALAQVAHFDTNARMPGDKFAIALNTCLPRDVRVLYSEDAPEGFHARFCAKEKSYRYHVQYGPHARVFSRDTALHVHDRLRFDLMRAEAAAVIGEHDFKAFMSAGSQMENTVRTVTASAWSRSGADWYYEVSGNGFLYNMVRILVGTMLETGKGLTEPGRIRRALESRLREDAGPTAPPQGLTLTRVRYPDFDTDEALGSCLLWK